MTRLLRVAFLLLALAGFALAQWASPPSSGYTTLNTFLSSLDAAQSGGGAPSGSCTAGKDFWFDTTNFMLYQCGATNTWYKAFATPYYIPLANCNNTTAGSGASIGSGGTATCRAGTNNLGGYIAITDTSSTFAQIPIAVPREWVSGTSQYPIIRFFLAYPGTDGSSSHTIIPQIKVSCMKGDGSTTDDVSFAAARSASTITLSSATANLFFTSSTITLNSTDMSGCQANSQMIVQIGRATDTATSAVNFYGITVLWP